jgi:hypothetical protein|tara:strand:- start:1562 stop:1828 length:267 start_codon:yes stop_codon:yes gene_type:complete
MGYFLKESSLTPCRTGALSNVPTILTKRSFGGYSGYWIGYCFLLNRPFLKANLQLTRTKFVRKRTNFTTILKTKKFFWSCYKSFISNI